MANVKITDLGAYTDPANTDVLPIVDVGADVTKKVSIADLLKNASAGTAAAPGIAFDGDSNTGIYRPGADQLAISTNGTERLRVTSDGWLGVGESALSAPLHVKLPGSGTIATFRTGSATDGGTVSFVNGPFALGYVGDGNVLGLPDAVNTTFVFRAAGNNAIAFVSGFTPTEKVRIDDQGRVTVSDGGNVVLGTTTGTKIGTSTSQKIGFYNATPVVQPTAVANITTTATSGSLPTPDGSVTIADATTPTVTELLEYCVELEAKLEAALGRLRTLGLIAS